MDCSAIHRLASEARQDCATNGQARPRQVTALVVRGLGLERLRGDGVSAADAVNI